MFERSEMKIQILAAIIISAWALTSCGQPSPTELAKAEAIRVGTSLEAEREHIVLQERRIDVAVKDATKDDRIAFWENVTWWGGIVTCLCVVISGGCYCYFVAFRGGRAVARAAENRAMMFHVSPHTRMYPGFLKDGRIYLPETGESRNMKDDTPPDYRLLAVHHRLAEVGLLVDGIVKVAKSTREPSPADMLPSVASSVPMLEQEKKS
jgi:hypothetical protein